MVTPEKKTLSPEKKSNVEKMKNLLKKEQNSETILVSAKLSNSTSDVIGTVRHLDKNGKDKWYHKGDHFALTIRNYVKHLPREDNQVQQALRTLDVATMRDNNRGVNDPKYPGAEKQDNKKKGTARNTKYPMKVPYFILKTDIPIDNKKRENEIRIILKKIGTEIRKIQLEDAYAICLDHAINNEKFK